MNKLRGIAVSIIWIVYIILILFKADIHQNVFTFLLSIVLLNQAIDEWLKYKDTKAKIHLLIPVTGLILITYIIIVVLF